MRTRFAENFTAILKLRDISQSQFAKLYGVRPSTINQWANGKREPTYHDLLCICILLNIDVKDILGYNPRTRESILYDIICSNVEFQNEQRELQAEMRNAKKEDFEIIQACQDLYKKKYEEYKKIFNFDD